jgi:hypothetical protein
MIKKLEDNIFRICKECPPYLLFVFYQEGEERLKFKVIGHLQNQQNHLQPYYFKDYVYAEMPDLIRLNFANLREIFEEIQQTSRSNFGFDQQAGLRVGLQVGTKVRFCLFQLQAAEHTYLETVEALLWQAESEAENQQAPEQFYLHEMRLIRAVNERHTQEISHLEAKLKA